MPLYSLVIYSRRGCCLCEGLESRLRRLQLHQMSPALELVVVDIDAESTPSEVRCRYDLQVPVLVIRKDKSLQEWALPRVSPRLKQDALAIWLQGACMKVIE